jgi:hypothetical protein
MQTFTITEEIRRRASVEQTFDSLIANMGRPQRLPTAGPLP